MARLAIAVGGVAVVLAVTAFSATGSTAERRSPRSRPASPVTSAPPEPLVLATVGNLRVQSPVAQGGVTAVGFHGSDEDALVLQPVGPQANEGLLARLWHRITGSTHRGLPWYQLESGALRTLDVGAVAGTDVYSPVDGTVVALPRPHHLGTRGRRRDRAAALVRTVARRDAPARRARSALTVGANVAAGSSKLGTVVDITRFEQQALARYAADGGNNVAIQVFPSATLGVP